MSGGWRGIGGGGEKEMDCVRLESGISAYPDGGGYEGEHEDELEGPEGDEDSFEPRALGVVGVVHAVRRGVGTKRPG